MIAERMCGTKLPTALSKSRLFSQSVLIFPNRFFHLQISTLLIYIFQIDHNYRLFYNIIIYSRLYSLVKKNLHQLVSDTPIRILLFLSYYFQVHFFSTEETT